MCTHLHGLLGKSGEESVGHGRWGSHFGGQDSQCSAPHHKKKQHSKKWKRGRRKRGNPVSDRTQIQHTAFLLLNMREKVSIFKELNEGWMCWHMPLTQCSEVDLGNRKTKTNFKKGEEKRVNSQGWKGGSAVKNTGYFSRG